MKLLDRARRKPGVQIRAVEPLQVGGRAAIQLGTSDGGDHVLLLKPGVAVEGHGFGATLYEVVEPEVKYPSTY